jgi:hypothetical protein
LRFPPCPTCDAFLLKRYSALTACLLEALVSSLSNRTPTGVPIIKESTMAPDPQKPPRNRDQEQPPRKGDTIEPTILAEREEQTVRNAPLPEEETYEREPVNQPDGNRQIDS